MKFKWIILIALLSFNANEALSDIDDEIDTEMSVWLQLAALTHVTSFAIIEVFQLYYLGFVHGDNLNSRARQFTFMTLGSNVYLYFLNYRILGDLSIGLKKPHPILFTVMSFYLAVKLFWK